MGRKNFYRILSAMRVSTAINPNTFHRFRERAAKAYALQYHAVTPASVLQHWIRLEYKAQEWQKARHYRNEHFLFVFRGNFPIGFIRYSTHRDRLIIEKIWIQRNFRKHKGSRLLLQSLGNVPIQLDIYAGNSSALQAFRKLGYRVIGECSFRALGFVQEGRVMQRS